MKLDILVFAAHPDDAELSCAGTIIHHVKRGKKVGIVDLTRGELGTRGTPQVRLKESRASAKIMQLSVRDNLKMQDGFFQNNKNNQIKIIRKIREYKPEIILANAVKDRHPDHARAAELVRESFFLSGLSKIETKNKGKEQKEWRAKLLYHYIQSRWITPDVIVDVSDSWKEKMVAIAAFKSQFHDPRSKEPETYISSPEFLKMIESRGKELGHAIGVQYGEGFTVDRTLGTDDLFNLA
jgi:bacillithiol biosynthesis deacetylase BshB1